MTTQVVFLCRVQVECDCNYFITEGLSILSATSKLISLFDVILTVHHR